jgi:phosphoribosylamine--glycine ligase
MSEPINILIVGSGGREHALVEKCLLSPLAKKVIAAPGNGGIVDRVPCYPVAAEAVDEMVKLAISEAIDLVIVGPEVPLSLGLANALRERGIATYGPDRTGAQLESSKAFCKNFFARHGIPTADYATFTEVDAALDYLNSHPAPIVIKASGLAAGKGVIMAQTHAEACEAVRAMLEGDAFGDSGKEIVIEEWLEGEETSIHVICSGEEAIILPASQDHKRIGEGDTGPNTGGMGAYAPAPLVNAALMECIRHSIIEPTIKGLRADGIDFRGTLYAGIMLTAKGPKMLEYNVRFGDPETQVLLPLIESDLVPLLYAAARGEPFPQPFVLRQGYSAVVVVLAAAGYPGKYRQGDTIELPQSLPDGASILHAGTRRNINDHVITCGGRVLGVSALAPTLAEAADIAYQVAGEVFFEGKYLRRDIGHRALRNAG